MESTNRGSLVKVRDFHSTNLGLIPAESLAISGTASGHYHASESPTQLTGISEPSQEASQALKVLIFAAELGGAVTGCQW